MAQLTLSGDTSGSVAIVAPAIAGTTTFTLDTTSGILASPIGVGQTWTNVAASRVVGTTYTNSTGKPIFVAIHLANATGLTINFIINGSTFVSGYAASGIDVVFQMIVPSSATYSVSGGAIQTWSELR